MEDLSNYHEIAATCLVRVILGLLFLFQGVDTVFNIGMKNVVETYKSGFKQRVPSGLISIAAYFTAYTELIGGTLVLFGLFQYVALYLLSVNLIIAAIGFGMVTPLWDMRNVWPRLILLLILLYVPVNWSIWSLDNLFFN